jgi:predicted ATPase
MGVEVPRAKREFPAFRRAGNLPAELTTFVGRDAEVAAVIRLIGSSRLVTLTGAGGVGKTRLALRAAAAAAAGRAWLVELSSLRDPQLLGSIVARTLGVADQTSRPQLDVLADYLRSRELLLILDTCEHLRTACADLARALLRAAPGLRVLATSRQALGLPGEAQLIVAPLPVPDAEAADDALAESDSVKLFAARARDADPAFSLTPGALREAGRLCRMLDGIPLALELAAGRLRTLPLDRLAGGLDDGLVSGGRSPLPNQAQRHQTLRTTIGWSHELCAPAERLLWARLAVFAGQFDASTAADVCADDMLPRDSVERLLGELAGKSIVLRGGGRYRLLDTVREYGLSWLRELGAEDQMRRRHRDHFLALARRCEAEWCGPDQIGWCRTMHRVLPDLSAALDFCLANPAEHETGLDLAGRLWIAWWSCGYIRDGRYYLDRALALGSAGALSSARTRALWARGMLAVSQGDATRAVGFSDEAWALATARRDSTGQGFAAYLRGVATWMSGDVDASATLLRQAADVLARSAAPMGQILALASLVMTCSTRGEAGRAIAAHEEMTAVCFEHGETWGRSYGDYTRAAAELGRGRIDAAARFGAMSLDITYGLGDILGIALTLDLLAATTGAAGHPDRGATLLGAANRMWTDFGLPQLGRAPALAQARDAVERDARERLGDQAFEAAYSAGSGFGVGEAVSYARAS